MLFILIYTHNSTSAAIPPGRSHANTRANEFSIAVGHYHRRHLHWYHRAPVHITTDALEEHWRASLLSRATDVRLVSAACIGSSGAR